MVIWQAADSSIIFRHTPHCHGLVICLPHSETSIRPLTLLAKTMDLILWRHAEAEEGPQDMQRKLTARGHKQAESMARWLIKQLPEDTRILVSPAVRTLETADHLGLPYQIERRIAPDACVSGLLSAANWPEQRGTVLLVGHQPSLGSLAGLLLAGQELPLSIKKSAVWWFSNRVRRDESQTVLRLALSADMLKA